MRIVPYVGLRCLLLLAGTGAAWSEELRVAAAFSDHMVLQRDRAIPVWGWAAPGAKVRVALGDHHVDGAADTEGRWLVTLRPRPANQEGRTLKACLAEHPDTTTVRIEDVLVGDVWLCAGSFGRFTRAMRNLGNRVNEVTLDRCNNAQVRVFRPPLHKSLLPLEDFSVGRWIVSSEKSVLHQSVVSYFGIELQRATGVPVGVIVAGTGNRRGSPAHEWLSWERTRNTERMERHLSILRRREEAGGRYSTSETTSALGHLQRPHGATARPGPAGLGLVHTGSAGDGLLCRAVQIDHRRLRWTLAHRPRPDAGQCRAASHGGQRRLISSDR